MKAKKRRHALLVMYWLAISAIENPLCLTEAIKLEKSCTPPKNMQPSIIHTSVGNHPKAMPATMGPTMGPAPAIEEK